MLWLLASWAFSRADQFQSITWLALQNSTKLINASDLPIKAYLLSRVIGILFIICFINKFTERIDQDREDTVAQIFAAV